MSIFTEVPCAIRGDRPTRRFGLSDPALPADTAGIPALVRCVDYLAYYDALTRLAKRTLFMDRLSQYLRSSAAGGRQAGCR